MTKVDCVNARLVRFEFGSIADLPNISDFPTANYYALVFSKGGVEIREVFNSRVASSFDISYLQYLNKVVALREERENKITFHFTDGTWISMS